MSSPKKASINDNIRRQHTHVAYSSVEDAAHLMQHFGTNMLLAKIDVKEAYRIIPIHPDDWPFLGLHWKGQVYIEARSQLWSNYKHHNIVKFLIGISPQGVVSFISEGWGGCVSDVQLTEECGLLRRLLPGDVVLADRGFTIQESVGMFCAEVKTPPFTQGRKQLSKFEVDTARQLSRVRIHVERVIGVIRQRYTILESTLPIDMIMCDEEEDFSILDKIVTVCCALCNCCDSVVNFE